MASTIPPASTPSAPASPASGSHGQGPWSTIGAFAIAALIGGVVGGFVGYFLHSSSGPASAATSAAANSASCSVPKVANEDLPSVVTISAKKGPQEERARGRSSVPTATSSPTTTSSR